MKKKMIITILTVFLLSVLSVTAFAFTAGDVNEDGSIKAADARLALRYSAKLEKFSDEQIKAADVDNSGKVTASDARKILRESAKLTKDFISVEIYGKLIENGVLKVAVCADNQPFAYVENATLKGINIAMAQKIADSYDLELEIDNLPEEELINCVKNNQYDIAFVSASVDKNNFASEGIDSYRYYRNTHGVWFRENQYPRPTINDIKGQDSKIIGVVKNSVADVLVTRAVENGEFGNSSIKRYPRYIDGKKALLNNETDVFIGEENIAYSGTDMYDYFTYEDMLMITSHKKGGLIDSMKKPVGENAVKSIIAEFCPGVSDSRIYAEVGEIQIAEGGTSVIEIIVDSFYGNADPMLISSPYKSAIHIKENSDGKNRFFLSVSVPSDSKNGKIRIAIGTEPDVTCDIPVEVVKDVVGVYNFGMYNSLMPDFGTVIGIAPKELNVYTKEGNVAYIYSANEIIKAGFTDNTFIEYFFALMLQQGFVLKEENIGSWTYQLVFTNEYSGEEVRYTESYDDVDEYLSNICIFLKHKF